MQIQVPFTGGEQEARVSSVNAQRTVNLYPEKTQAGGKNKAVLYSTPGLKKIGLAGIGPIRSNGTRFNNKLYFASSNEIYSIDSNDAVSKVGTINTQAGRVNMAAGRNKLAIVDGKDGWTWDDNGNFDQITDTDFEKDSKGNTAPPTFITYLDGFFIINKPGSDEVAISNNEDPTTWDTLDFAVAESRPDNITALGVYHGELYLLGEQTTEVFYNSGNRDFPFERYSNGILDWAIAAPNSLATRSKVGLCWLAKTEEGGYQVVQGAGMDVTTISDNNIEWQIQELINNGDPIDDAIGWIYEQAGKTFYWLTFPTAGKSLVVDLSNGEWHERKAYGKGRHRANGHGFLNGKHIVGDFDNGKLYQLDFNSYTDDGEVIERIRRSPVIHKERSNLFMHSLEVEFESGMGTLTGQGSDPTAMLQLSYDGGRTWTNSLFSGIGKRGEYLDRAVWFKLGYGRQIIVEVTVTDPVPVTMIAAYANVQRAEHDGQAA